MIIEIEQSNFWEHGLSSLQHSYVQLEILLIGRLKTRQFTPHTHKIIWHHNHQFSGGKKQFRPCLILCMIMRWLQFFRLHCCTGGAWQPAFWRNWLSR